MMARRTEVEISCSRRHCYSLPVRGRTLAAAIDAAKQAGWDVRRRWPFRPVDHCPAHRGR